MEYTEVLRSDDRSDSGVSSVRTGNYASGDERSGSRSSALSSTDETQQSSHSLSNDYYKTSISSDRKLNVPPKPVYIWRDPNLIAESTVHQVQSIQHQTLLMSSHSSSSPSPAAPPVSSPVVSQIHIPSPHPLQHLPPPGLYSHHSDAVWKQQYASRPPATQLSIAEVERDRQERMYRDHREVDVCDIVNLPKGKEKLDRERHERDKQMERDRECNERLERERRATEQAVHKHFEESLRLAQHKHNLAAPRWNIINSLPPPPEEARKRSEQEPVHPQQLISADRGRQESLERSYLSVVPRPTSGFKVEYPTGHSRAKQVSEKPMVHTLPKAEPNFNVFGYTAYQHAGYLAHEGNKVKSEPSKTPLTSLASISVSKSSLNLERDREPLSNPPPLTSDVKSSVIVKNEGKSPLHHDSSKLSHQHSPSPKHQIVPTQQMLFHKTSGYDFQSQPRAHISPSHSPHHLNSHHMSLEAQNLVGKAQLSPHSQRQLPPPSSAEQRFKVAALNAFPYAMPVVTYGISAVAGNTKPKVSSPAPGHMYMKPSPSPQPLLHAPPPAHRTSLGYNSRLYPPKVQAPTPAMNRSPVHPASCQTQPLDLGLSNAREEHSVSPKRKVGTSIPTTENNKRQRCDPPGSYSNLPHSLGHSLMSQNSSTMSYPVQPMLSRVGEPSPLIASAATTITTVVNTVAYCSPAVTMSTSLAAVTPVVDRPLSADSRPSSAGCTPVPPNQHCSSPLPLVTCSTPPAEDVSTPPCTPLKVSSVDSDKSNSPGPIRSQASYPVHKLKKAWLQRHSGEDGAEDNSVSAGTGSATPTTLTATSASVSICNKDSVNNSSDCPAESVQTELSGSVGKNRQASSGNHKGSPILPTSKGNSGVFINGHTNELPSSKPSVDDDSSSSGSDRELKTSRKRKPPKVKKKKGSSAALRKAAAEELKRKRLAAMAASESSGSDKESATDKDSDSGATKKAANNKEPRKRGRRPKGSKFTTNSEPRPKKPQSQPAVILRDPFLKPPVAQLKKTGESFLQDGACFEVAPKLAKCRECRWTPNQRSKNTPNIFCRFYAFRRLRYTKNGQLAIAGFSDPHQDASEEDLRLWLPFLDTPPAELDLDVSRLILMQVGDQFCDLLQQESACPEIHMSEDKTIAWKRVVQGVREMCDVCETTLFNFHWACGKCGFVVCIDCYKGRKNGTVKVWIDSDREGKDEYLWLSCTNRQAHEQEKLMLTQIIAGDSLVQLGKKSHEARALWGIPQYCGCDASKVMPSKEMKDAAKDLLKNLLKSESVNGLLKPKEENVTSNGATTKDDKNSLNWLAEVALSNEDKMSSSDTDIEEKDGNYSTLRELLIRPSHKPSNSRSSSPSNTASPTNAGQKGSNKSSRLDTLDEVISSVIEHSVQRKEEVPVDSKKPAPVLEHFVRRYNWYQKDREPLPIRIMTLTESKILYPDLPHAWLCDGKLLRLTDPTHVDNRRIFADQWKRGQPVLVSDVSKHLDNSLWHPDSFANDFGDEKNDLINCMTGNLVPNQPMRKFWEGFEYLSRRLKDEHGNAMLLKLKDWPPGEDFAEMLPSRFKDLMHVLPMPEYTNRSGYLNLASRLPDCFVRPDLGPKMYNAYGSALHPSKGTTNLHLDISDAVNVMVFVGIPVDSDSDEHIKEAFRAIDEAGCDILTRRRVRDKGELPGALWHIYHSRDADKIRDLLNKVSLERGNRLEPHHDPIHDQSWYLDSTLRERLYKEYSVEGYAIVQCLGDAVFIPAGAPHQVRNLHNCIKVAEDFVSPENVSHCFHLTQEFRELSNEHTNHEDKLQIKNIIYHAVKDSVAVLSKYAREHLKEKAQSLEKVKENASDECDEQHSDSADKAGSEVPVSNKSSS